MTTAELAFEPVRRRVLDRLESLSRGLAASKIPPWADPGGKAAEALLEARRRLEDHIRFRFGRGAGAPAVVVLFGGTGVGKSTILNTLAGKPVTETSARRPCTTEPLLVVHRSAAASISGPDFLPAYAKKTPTPGQPKAGTMGLEVLSHDDEALASLVLVDAPDFDSVETANRRVAEDLYRIADLVIFVVNPSKYADEETWKAIRRAKADGKSTAFVFNRAEPDDAALADFRALLEGPEVIALPRDPAAPAAGMIADPAVRARLDGILRAFLLGEAADKLRRDELGRSWKAFAGLLDSEVLPALWRAKGALEAGQAASTVAASDASRALVEEVKIDASNDQERIARMVRENLFSLVDKITRPVIGPIVSLFDKVSGFFGRKASQDKSAIESALQRVHENNRQAARKHLGLAHDRVARALASVPGGPALSETREFVASLLPTAEIEQRYDHGRAEFDTWKRAEFDKLVGDIRTKKSAQLFVVQALYGTITIATMAHTGGAFKLVEGVLAGPIIVALDKVFIGAINWDLVRDLADRGRTRFLALFTALTEEQGLRWEKNWKREAEGIAALAGLEEDMKALREDVPACLAAMERG